MFSAFHLVSVHLFNKGIQEEIIQNNRMMLSNTAERYQIHFERIKTLLFNLYNNEYVIALNKQSQIAEERGLEYSSVSKLLKELRSQAYNPMLLLDNLIVYYPSTSTVIEKEGTLDADMMFTRFYVSDSTLFWRQLEQSDDAYQLHQEQRFTVSTVNDHVEVQLIPVTFRMPSSNYLVIAFLDAKKMKESFYNKDDDRQFIILDESGSPLYQSSGSLSFDELPNFNLGQDYVVSGDYIFFREEHSKDKLTYITAVPYSNITSKVNTASMMMFVILGVSVTLGLLISIYFSRNINRPLHQIMTSLIKQEPVPISSTIHEFDLIQRKLGDLVQEKDAINKKLSDKQSLLTHYSYINKLKAITSDINEWKDIAHINEPYYIILFQLQLRLLNVPEQVEPHKIAYYLKKYIDVILSEQLPGTHTLQIEQNQIISLVQADSHTDNLGQALALFKQSVDRDSDSYLVMIGVSDIYKGSGSFNHAYEEVLQLVQLARPIEECQILHHLPAPPAPLVFTLAQEQELFAHLQAGNAAAGITALNRLLDQCEREQSTVVQLQQLAYGVLSRVTKLLEPYGDKENGYLHEDKLAELRECWTINQFKQFYLQLFDQAAMMIQEGKGEEPPAITFIMEYMERRYADDLSLEQLADKLQLSSTYLSVYIKEKTGANFSEHLNNIRIRRAKELLADPNLSVQDISLQIGYRNVTSFIRMFKKITGFPPGEYRKHARWKDDEQMRPSAKIFT